MRHEHGHHLGISQRDHQARSEAGGTSGIVIDNVSSLAQASSIYFSTLATTTCGDGNSGGCAVKLTQAGLN
jgi:hypothetical protein